MQAQPYATYAADKATPSMIVQRQNGPPFAQQIPTAKSALPAQQFMRPPLPVQTNGKPEEHTGRARGPSFSQKAVSSVEQHRRAAISSAPQTQIPQPVSSSTQLPPAAYAPQPDRPASSGESSSKPVFRPSPGCLAIMRLIEFAGQLPLLMQADRVFLDKWLEDFFLESGSVKLILRHADGAALTKEFTFPSLAVPQILSAFKNQGLEDLQFSLHNLREHLVTQASYPATASVVGYLVECGSAMIHTTYNNGAQVIAEGNISCRFVRIPAFSPDGSLLSASLKIDHLVMSIDRHSHAVARSMLEPPPKQLLAIKDSPAKNAKLFSRLVMLPEIVTGPYGIPDSMLTVLFCAESVGNTSDLMTLTSLNEDPTQVLSSFLDITKGRISSNLSREPSLVVPASSTTTPLRPPLAVETSRIASSSSGPSSAPPSAGLNFAQLQQQINNGRKASVSQTSQSYLNGATGASSPSDSASVMSNKRKDPPSDINEGNGNTNPQNRLRRRKSGL